MGVQITVRGAAEARCAAERALVRLDVVADGPDREDVRDRVASVHGPLIAQLADLHDAGAVTTWSSDQVHVHTRRDPDDGLVHGARVQVSAELVDFERLNRFVDDWSGRPGVEIHGLVWDLTPRSRVVHEAAVRTRAVEDAVAKAQAYADAVRRGRVVAVEIADPGMLERHGDAPPSPGWARADAFAADGRDAPGLDLVPPEIVVRVEVDARFTAP